MIKTKYRTVCNVSRSAISGMGKASYQLYRSLIYKPYAYPSETEFEFESGSSAGWWLRDQQGIVVFVPEEQKNCFEFVK
jgi:hypothetical protein